MPVILSFYLENSFYTHYPNPVWMWKQSHVSWIDMYYQRKREAQGLEILELEALLLLKLRKVLWD